MITFCCWKWRPRPGYRSTFGPETVNVLRRMIERHYHAPHELVCITDDAEGIDPEVRIIPLWKDHANLRSPHGGNNPSCYRRLKAFSAEAAELIAPRFVSIDLDCVITGDITPLFAGDEEFRIWGDTAKGTPYNGGLWMLRAGTRTKVWDTFDPIKSPLKGRRLRYVGSDQAWIAACLGPNELKWSAADGVYSFRNQIAAPRGNGRLPKDARVTMFHGCHDPWQPDVMRAYPWISEHYR
jgi:hypothetical protein